MFSTEYDATTAEYIPEETNEQSNESIQLKAVKEQLLRATADFENFRRRTERDRSEWINVARVTAIKQFLPISDDIERALAALPAKELAADKTLIIAIDGLSLIQKNLSKSLQDSGVEEIVTTGMFNPELHEALMQVEKDGLPSGAIVQTFEKGYKLGTSIIRHSKVSVAK